LLVWSQSQTAIASTVYRQLEKNCPDYEIIEWNEDNFDLNCCDYVRESMMGHSLALCTYTGL
jgi:hypothetical protein